MTRSRARATAASAEPVFQRATCVAIIAIGVFRTSKLTSRLHSSPSNHQGCFNITTVFSHSQTVVLCGSCSAVLCQPTGGKARLTEGCSFRPKVQ